MEDRVSEAPPRSADESLIHLHIPKCGGTTLRSLLVAAVPQAIRFEVDSRNIAGSRALLTCLPERKRGEIRLLHGHLSYGWHELLPRRVRYITVLRDPDSRVISHYNYVRSRPDHYLYDELVGSKMSLVDYVESGLTCEVNNGQVRQISGVEDIIQEPYGESQIRHGSDHSALLEQALDNIERYFVVVGILERFDETLKALTALIGLPIVPHKVLNATQDTRLAIPLPTGDEIKRVRRYNQEDHELYRIMCERFDLLMKKITQGGNRRMFYGDIFDRKEVERGQTAERAHARIHAALVDTESSWKRIRHLLAVVAISPKAIVTKFYARAWLRVLARH
jgi:hypothetical protein